jgi:hypothetical protein
MIDMAGLDPAIDDFTPPLLKAWMPRHKAGRDSGNV